MCGIYRDIGVLGGIWENICRRASFGIDPSRVNEIGDNVFILYSIKQVFELEAAEQPEYMPAPYDFR